MREAREAVLDYARLCGFGSAQLNDIEIAVGEALANAVEHGTKDLGFIGIECSHTGRSLIVEIRDDGPGFDFTAARRRDPGSVRGFGIALMRSLMDDVRYLCGGNLVRLTKVGPLTAENGMPAEEQA